MLKTGITSHFLAYLIIGKMNKPLVITKITPRNVSNPRN